MEKIVLLLRGINVGGHRRLPMAELRAAAVAAGFADIETYIQSGNLVFSAESPAVAEAVIEALVEQRFGFRVEAIARSARQWAAYAAASPFADADDRANIIHLGLSKKAPAATSAEALQARAAHGETVVVAGDAIWIDFHAGVANSKLTPASIDKGVGSTVTLRNWRTVRKLAEMAGLA